MKEVCLRNDFYPSLDLIEVLREVDLKMAYEENAVGKKGARITHVLNIDMPVSNFKDEIARPRYKGCSIVGTFAVVYNERGLLAAKAKKLEEKDSKVTASEDDDE